MTASSRGSLTFTFQDLTCTPDNGEWFYLDGLPPTGNAAPVDLDSPGEWYLNINPQTHSNTLYLWTPTGDSPANHTVEAKAREYGFDLSGRSYITIQGINIFACSINTSSTSSHDTINGIQALYVSQFEFANGLGSGNQNTPVAPSACGTRA